VSSRVVVGHGHHGRVLALANEALSQAVRNRRRVDPGSAGSGVGWEDGVAEEETSVGETLTATSASIKISLGTGYDGSSQGGGAEVEVH
jgi:hypothetical protein